MATAALPVVRSATSAAKSDTLHAAVRRVVATAADLEADSVVGNRPAILAVVSATWLVTAPRAKSATTVSWAASTVGILKHFSRSLSLGGEIGHVSRDCSTEAKGERVCYQCKQPGHVQAACPN